MLLTVIILAHAIFIYKKDEEDKQRILITGCRILLFTSKFTVSNTEGTNRHKRKHNSEQTKNVEEEQILVFCSILHSPILLELCWMTRMHI